MSRLPPVRTRLAPFRVAGFRRLLGSYVLNQLGDSIALVALSVVVYDRSQSALATAGLFVAAKFLPAFLSPPLVAQLDRFAVRRVLAAVYALEAVTFGALALLAIHYAYAPIIALALVDGTLALTARALSRGAAATVLEPAGLLRAGNAVMNVGFGIAVVSGTLLGGVIVAGMGGETGLAIDAATFLLVAVLMLGLNVELPSERAPEPVLERLRAGLRHVRTHPVLPILLTGQALALMLFYLIIPIEVVYAKETLGTGDAGFGLLLGAWSAGILIGSLVYVRIADATSTTLVVVSTGTIGVAYAGMAATSSLTVACVLSVGGGIGNGFQWVSVMTMVQEATPADLQARVVGLLESIGAAMPGVGFLLGGALTAIWSPRVAYAVAGVGVIALAVAGAALLTPRRPRAAPSDAA